MSVVFVTSAEVPEDKTLLFQVRLVDSDKKLPLTTAAIVDNALAHHHHHHPHHTDHFIHTECIMDTSIPSVRRNEPELEHPTPLLSSSPTAESHVHSVRSIPPRDTTTTGELSRPSDIHRGLVESHPLLSHGILLGPDSSFPAPAIEWLEGDKTPTQSNVELYLQPLPPPHRMKKDKSVRFSTLTIRHYERILGDNPSCSSGPALSIGWKYKEAQSIELYEYERARWASTTAVPASAAHPWSASIPGRGMMAGAQRSVLPPPTFRVVNPIYYPNNTSNINPPLVLRDSGTRLQGNHDTAALRQSMDSTRHSIGSTVSTSSLLTGIHTVSQPSHHEDYEYEEADDCGDDDDDDNEDRPRALRNNHNSSLILAPPMVSPNTPVLRSRQNASDRCSILTRQEREDLLISLGYSRATLVDAVRQNIKVKNQRRQTVNNLKVAKAEEVMERISRSFRKLYTGKKGRSRYMYDEWLQQQQQQKSGVDNQSKKSPR